MHSHQLIRWMIFLLTIALVVVYGILLLWIPKTKRGWIIFAVLGSVYAAFLFAVWLRN